MQNSEALLEQISAVFERHGIAKESLQTLLPIIHPADLAIIVEDLEPEDQLALFQVFSAQRAAEVLDELRADTKAELLQRMEADRLAPVIQQLAPDAQADLVEMMPAGKEDAVLRLVSPTQAAQIQKLLEYAPTTAGGRMTTNFVSVRETQTAREAIAALQGALHVETADYIYAVDEQNRIVGVLTLRSLIMVGSETPVNQVMRREVITTRVETDQEEVANVVAKYDLRAIPVVDQDRRLLGVVTFDDVMDVIHEEAEEDIARLTGAGSFDPIRDSIGRRIRGRLPWLLTTLVGELALAWMLQFYEAVIQAKIVLILFMPVACAMGGNFGLQSSTIVVRGLATGQLQLSKVFRLVLQESCVALGIGAIAGTLSGFAAWGISGEPAIGFIVASGMLAGITLASLSGTMIPAACFKMGIDPALAAGPFITVLNDITCVLTYLTIAWMFIPSASA